MTKKDKKASSTRKRYTFKRVSENLYKVIETGGYYALVKRGGKQIRRSLKTTDKALAKRRLAELKQKASKLRTGKEEASITFERYQLSILCLCWLPALARRVGPGFLPYQADLAVRMASAKLLNAPG